MDSSTAKQITTPANHNFFLAPQFPLQRQYEALRAFLVDDEPSADVARRFGYSPGAFRVLCYQFRHDPQKRASFFRQPLRGPQSSPARDRVRDLAVAMRKRNLSVYDMQRELAAAGHTISINSLIVLLREEGFSRLPRRADDERPVTVKPEVADVADVRRLDLSPASFRTPLAGLFLFLPLLDRIDLQAVVTAARLPSSQMIPAAQALRSLLALKLIGAERKSHVMDLVTDRAMHYLPESTWFPSAPTWRPIPHASTTRSACASWRLGWNRSRRPACPTVPLLIWTFIACPPTAPRNLWKNTMFPAAAARRRGSWSSSRATPNSGFCAMLTPV